MAGTKHHGRERGTSAQTTGAVARRLQEQAMKREEFRFKLKVAHDSKDDGAWAMCDFALECWLADYPQWDVKIAVHERRSPRTVRDWARSAKIRQNIKRVGDLTYPFYLVAMRHLDLLSLEQVRDMMQTYADTPGATLESFAAELHRLAAPGDPGPAPLLGADAERESPALSIVLPLWTAETVAESLPRIPNGGARFVALEGAEWAD